MRTESLGVTETFQFCLCKDGNKRTRKFTVQNYIKHKNIHIIEFKLAIYLLHTLNYFPNNRCCNNSYKLKLAQREL